MSDKITQAVSIFTNFALKELKVENLQTVKLTYSLFYPGRRSRKAGHYLHKCWVNPEDKEDFISEIMLNHKIFTRKNAVYETILHELVHCYNAYCGIDDCSELQYHNKRFKEGCEIFWLNCSKHKTRGWATTDLTEKSKELIEKFKVAHPKWAAIIDYKPSISHKSYAQVYTVPVTEDVKQYIREEAAGQGMKMIEFMDMLISNYRAQNDQE